MMDVTEALETVVKFGRYQKAFFPIFGGSLLLASSLIFIQVFAAGKSDHWCRSWEKEDCSGYDVTKTECEYLKRELSVPYTVDEHNETIYAQCEKYNVSGIAFDSELLLERSENRLEKIPCDEGWIHDQSTFPSTIIIDFELVCDKSHQPNVAQTAYFAGYLVGSFFGGILSDVIGRRWTIITNTVLTIASGIATVFSPSMWMYILLRFMTGTCVRATNISIIILGSELVPPSKRMQFLNALNVFWTLGYFLLTGLAKLIPNWRFVQLAITLPYIPLVMLYFFFLVESPFWFSAKQRYEDAEKILQKMAKINGKELTDATLHPAKEKVETVSGTEDTKELLKKLLRNPRVMLVTVLMCFQWFVQSILYYGLSLSTSSLGIDPYLSFVVSGAIEIPASVVCMYLPDLIGRKLTGIGAMILGGLSCCLTILLPLGLWRALLATVGKFFAVISFCLVYTWSAELYPTTLRSTAMGIFSVSSRIGGILVPFMLILEDVWISLPLLNIGSITIIAGLLCLLLPETNGQPLPSSFDDIENIYGLSVMLDKNIGNEVTDDQNKDLEEK